MASGMTMMLFLVTLLLLNLIIIMIVNVRKKNPPFWASGFHLSMESLPWKSLNLGVCIWFPNWDVFTVWLTWIFLEDAIGLLLKLFCFYFFSHPTRSYKMGFTPTPRPMQLILTAAFIYHQHIVFWVNPLSVLSDACSSVWLIISK